MENKFNPVYAKCVKFNDIWILDLSWVGKFTKAPKNEIKMSFQWKIAVRTKREQLIYNFFNKILEIFKKNSILILLKIADRIATRFLEIHENLENKQKEYLGYDEQFDSVFTKEDYIEMAVMCSNAIKKKPTLKAIMNQFNISKRQAWKVKCILIERINF